VGKGPVRGKHPPPPRRKKKEKNARVIDQPRKKKFGKERVAVEFPLKELRGRKKCKGIAVFGNGKGKPNQGRAEKTTLIPWGEKKKRRKGSRLGRTFCPGKERGKKGNKRAESLSVKKKKLSAYLVGCPSRKKKRKRVGKGYVVDGGGEGERWFPRRAEGKEKKKK